MDDYKVSCRMIDANGSGHTLHGYTREELEAYIARKVARGWSQNGDIYPHASTIQSKRCLYCQSVIS